MKNKYKYRVAADGIYISTGNLRHDIKILSFDDDMNTTEAPGLGYFKADYEEVVRGAKEIAAKMTVIKYENTELKAVVSMAKKAGYEVWTFKTSNNIIGQVFVVDAADRSYGTVSADFSGVKYSTCHKPNKACGNGFALDSETRVASLRLIKRTFCTGPGWASGYFEHVQKLTWEQKLKASILEFYKL